MPETRNVTCRLVPTLFLAFVGAIAVDAASWKQVGQAVAPLPSGGQPGELTKIGLALDSLDNSRPYVAYCSLGLDDAFHAGVKKYTTTWAGIGGYASPGGAEGVSLALKPGVQGRPWVAFIDDNQDSYLSVAAWEAGQWVLKGSAISADMVGRVTLVFAGSQALVSYQDYAYDGKLTVQSYDSLQGWKTVGDPGFTPGEAEYPTLAAKGGNYYVAFSNSNDSKQRGAVYKLIQGSWEKLGGYFSSLEARNIALAVHPKYPTRPYVAFTDAAHGNKVSVVTYASGKWSYVGLPGFAGPFSGYNSLAFGGDGTLYVAHQCGAKYSLCVRKYNSSTKKWVPVGPQPLTTGSATDFVLQVRGTTPYVAYRDDAKGGHVFVKMYA